MNHQTARRLGVTIVEMLVVIGVIVALAGVLLVALAAVKSSGEMTKSLSNLRQVGLMMTAYTSDNRDFIVPSQFDYNDNPYKGKVRSADSPASGNAHEGTWTDILWSVNEISGFADAVATLGQDYRHDSPDDPLYDLMGGSIDENPFRSSAFNRKGVFDSPPGEFASPFGTGANRVGEPGYFAANDFFNARPDRTDWDGVPAGGVWFTSGQIRFPDRSLYAIDSFAGEVIADEPPPFQVDTTAFDVGTGGGGAGGGSESLEVDFRYNEDYCLMLFLDGHAAQENRWVDLDDLEKNRKIRVRDLHRNPAAP